MTAGPAALPGPVQPFNLNIWQQARDRDGRGNVCAACDRDGTSRDPLVLAADGYRVHVSHAIAETGGGYYGEPFAVAS